MQYFGGKVRISKPLAEFLNSQLGSQQAFYDVFCGSCNVISKIDANRPRIANDSHKELIEMWRYVQQGGELPDYISEEQYKLIKNDNTQQKWLRAFVGFGCSFAGKYFGGYARGDTERNYCSNAKNSLLKKMKTLRNVIFVSDCFSRLNIPHKNSLLYCDIPYKGTTKYSTGDFNHEQFYTWARTQQWKGHSVFVSEYEHNVPDSWKVVWRHESKKDIRDKKGTQQPTVEILMTPC